MSLAINGKSTALKEISYSCGEGVPGRVVSQFFGNTACIGYLLEIAVHRDAQVDWGKALCVNF